MEALYILHGPSCIGKTTLLEKIKGDHIHKIEVDDCSFWNKEEDTSNWESLDIDKKLKDELLTYEFDPFYLKKKFSTKKDKYVSLYHLLTNIDITKKINITTLGAIPFNLNDFQFIHSWLKKVYNVKVINILVFKTLENYKKQIIIRYRYHRREHISIDTLLKWYDYYCKNIDYYDQIVYDIDYLKFL